MAYRKISGGSFFKWDEPGKELEGTWKGTREGKFGANGAVDTAEGTVVFSLTKILEDSLAGVQSGTQVKIIYLGTEKTKDGSGEYKNFEVYVDDGAEGAATDPAEDECPF